ncbi:e3 sumo protein ligase pli1 [Echinococcus multilocularis]|uniref:E3 sumo protein ligase pli1 n=1 Tax=Echinococcus multilocularis TaxID=6211 RepID=A0A068XZD7_ECHMU|nr:e3 sumo protein ligase pli1 [Echinococcus multilocularis]
MRATNCLLLILSTLSHLALSVFVDEDGLIAILYEIYREDTFPAFEKYPLEIFNPLKGPYYQKLAKLPDQAALHMAANGFPSGSLDGNAIPLYPSLEKDKILMYEQPEDNITLVAVLLCLPSD